MTSKELIKAIENCNEVKIVCHVHEHFSMYVKAVKADVLWNFRKGIKDVKKDSYKAQILLGNILLIG